MKEVNFSKILERLIDVFSGNETYDAREIRATFDAIIEQYRKALGGGKNHELFDSFLAYLNKRQELGGESRQDIKCGIEKILQSIKADIDEADIYVNGARFTSPSPYETANVTMRRTPLNESTPPSPYETANVTMRHTASTRINSADFHTYCKLADDPINEGTNRVTIYDNAPEPNAPEPQNPVHNSDFLTPARRQNAIKKPNNITLDDLFDKSKLEEIKSLVEQDKFNRVHSVLKPFIEERSIPGSRKEQTLEVLSGIKEGKVTLEALQAAQQKAAQNEQVVRS